MLAATLNKCLRCNGSKINLFQTNRKRNELKQDNAYMSTAGIRGTCESS